MIETSNVNISDGKGHRFFPLANEEHLDGLIYCYRTVWAESPQYREKVSQHEAKIDIANFTACWIALTADDRVAGFVGGYPLIQRTEHTLKSLSTDINACYWISDVGVLPEYQGQGIGGNLCDLFILSKLEDGIQEFLLCTAQNSTAAAHLYEKRGFRRIFDEHTNPVTLLISQMRTDGRKYSDRRQIFRMNAFNYVPGEKVKDLLRKVSA